jgi:hypothetical protein
MVDKGLRLTKMKHGAGFIEDDSDPWQHVTSAVGYGIYQTKLFNSRKQATTAVL